MRYLFILSLLAGKIFAGDSAGSGGDLIVCPGRETREVLDYFEARQADPNYKLGFSGSGGTAQDKVAWVLDRLRLRDPERAAAYRHQLDRFEMESSLVTGPLENVLDTGVVKIPPECEVHQLAIQRPPAFISDKRYLLDEALWASLSANPDQQAGLILHEIIYRETLGLGHEDSTSARYFNRIISSDDFLQLSQADYDSLVQDSFQAVLTVELTQKEYFFAGAAQQKLELALTPLLAHVGAGSVSWYTDAHCPDWLRFDGDRLVGTPPHAGSFVFEIIARQGDYGAKARVTLDVKGW